MSAEIPTTDPGVSEAAEAAAKIVQIPEAPLNAEQKARIDATIAGAAEAPKFGDVIPVESGSDAETLAAHNLAQAQANIARMTPPMPGSVDAGAPAETVAATPNYTVGPPPTATPEQLAAAVPPEAHFDAPAPKPEEAPSYPPVDEGKKNFTVINGN